ncbi:MAG: Dehydrogenase, partial [Halanaerobium sp. T82-1]
MDLKEKAKTLLYDFKGEEYALGIGILNEVGEY